MSLQSDFELCLEYAEKFESEQEKLSQAQNNIIFVLNESERLKNKFRLCRTFAVISAIITLFLVFIFMSVEISNFAEIIPLFVILITVFAVSLFNSIKIKKESDDFDAKKPSLTQQYTSTAENCERELARLIKEIYYEDLFDIVPADYFSVAAIEFCLTQVRKKLANTAKEAFRLLEAEIKRYKQMEYMEQLNNAQMEKLNDIQRAINVNTLITLAEQDKRKN